MDESVSTDIDQLRTLAIVGVVCIHATSPLINAAAGDPFHDRLFWSLVALNQAARFSVPAFFFLAGLLASVKARRWSAGTPGGAHAIGARLRRLLLPYVAWSLILWVVPSLLSRGAMPREAVARLLLGQTFTGGYFLIALAQLALVAPWLCRLAAARPRLFGGAAAGLLAATLCAEQIAASGGETGWAIIITRGFSAALSTGLVWAPFFMAGILGGLDPAGLRERLVRRAGWLVVLAAIALPLSVLEFRMVLEVTGSAGLAATFLKPSSIAVAIAFSGLALVVPAGPLAARVVRSLAPASFAIYLVHGGVIQAMTRLMPGAGRSMADAWIGVIGTILAGLALPLLLHRTAARRFPQPLNLLLFGRADARPAPSRRADSDGAGRHAAPDGGAPREAAPSWNAKAS
jgi:surface polysaccharide O-acyltransferase-like enzyme